MGTLIIRGKQKCGTITHQGQLYNIWIEIKTKIVWWSYFNDDKAFTNCDEAKAYTSEDALVLSKNILSYLYPEQK